MAQNEHIAAAIKKFKGSESVYDKADRYYRGDHDLAFATEKFKNAFGSLFRTFSLNLCPAICDAVRDKLSITEFGVEGADEEAKSAADIAWKIWQHNRMPLRAGEVHKEALKSGDAYVIVWPDAAGDTTIYPNAAKSCVVEYDAEQPGRVLWAAKLWQTADKRWRLNLFYPDRVEKYITKDADRETASTQDAGPRKYDRNFSYGTATSYASPIPEAKKFIEFTAVGETDFKVTNPYGVVPIFHFANNSSIGGSGISELASAMPIQDAMNKSVLDMLVTMEFAAFRQRYATGIEMEIDENGNPIPPFTAGVERLWTTENPDAKFGQFEATDLKQFLEVKESLRVDIASVTGTPIYYLMQTKGDFPSGEALKKSETRFISKVRDRQQSFGQVWEDLMAFVLKVENKGDVRLTAEWEDPAKLGEKEMLENVLLRKDIGISDEQALMEAGYGSDDIKRILREKQAKQEQFAKSFNSGEEVVEDESE